MENRGNLIKIINTSLSTPMSHVIVIHTHTSTKIKTVNVIWLPDPIVFDFWSQGVTFVSLLRVLYFQVLVISQSTLP